MNVEIILTRQVMSYFGLKPEDLPEVNLKKSGHWFSLWRMDLLPVDYDHWGIGGCFLPMVLTNAETRFTCVNPSHGSADDLRKNFETFFNGSLYLAGWPSDDYGRCKVRFVRGSHRSLARWMNQLLNSFVPIGVSHEEMERLDKVDGEFLEIPFSERNTQTVKERWIEFFKNDPPRFLPFPPDWGKPSKIIPFPGSGGQGMMR